MAVAIDCNGAVVLQMRLTAPLANAAWRARLDAVRAEALAGDVVIQDGTNRWRGTIVRAGVITGVCSALIVGGAGKLGVRLPAKSYTGAPARLVVENLLSAAGEKAEAKSLTSPLLRTVLEHWTRARGTVGEELTRVLESVGATWRILPSGEVWFGAAAFPKSAPKGLVTLDRDGSSGRTKVVLDQLDLVPATTVQGARVGDVQYTLNGAQLRATYQPET